MKEKLLNFIVSKLIIQFLSSLSPKDLKIYLDKMIDEIELYVQTTENKIDDNLLPVLKFTRDLFSIPDLPDK